MARTFTNPKNPWGAAGSNKDPQRSDMWQVLFSDAVAAIRTQVAENNDAFNALDTIQTYDVQSVALPEWRTKADSVRRDSRSYNMPSWDDPLDAIKMSFVVDSATETDPDKNQSPFQGLLAVMHAWRTLVRAGTGPVSTEYSLRLNANYRIDYAFDVPLLFVKGGHTPDQPASSTANVPSTGAPSNTGQPNTLQAQLSATIPLFNTLGISRTLILKNCWLSAFKFNDLNYEGGKVLTLDATFYADDIVDATLTSSTGKLYSEPGVLL